MRNRLSIRNGRRQFDPTRTTGLRNRFARQMQKRFNALKRDITMSIVDQDCFGFSMSTIRQLSATGRQQFAFLTDSQKLEQFMDWLRKQEEAGILELSLRYGKTNGWTNAYIDSAYQQGIRRAMTEMQAAGIVTEDVMVGIASAMAQPIHADAVRMLYARTFEDLKTVTENMNAAVRRAIADGLRSGLALGMAQGKSPDQIARALVADVNNRVDTIGITRAKLIARTEIIRAHHTANVQEYRRMGGDLEVTVLAEFASATDDRVCPECESLNGKTFTLDQVAGLIPVHPNCRCVAIPQIAKADKEAA